MTRATGATYRHVVELLAEQARPDPHRSTRTTHPAKEQR
jgi:hypothetical protein